MSPKAGGVDAVVIATKSETAEGTMRECADLGREGASDLSDMLGRMPRMSATEAARGFSNVLNRVARGEEVEVTRSGAPVAVIAPPKVRLVSAERFRELVASAPHPDEEFGDELRAIRESVEAPGEPWPS